MYKRPLLKELWDELDAVVYRLQTDGWDKGPLSAEDMKAWGIDIGQAQGIAYAIALVQDPLNPNIEWVRAEAMRRWEEHLGNPTPIGSGSTANPGVLRDRRRALSLRRSRGYGVVLGARRGGAVGAAGYPARVPAGRARRVAGR